VIILLLLPNHIVCYTSFILKLYSVYDFNYNNTLILLLTASQGLIDGPDTTITKLITFTALRSYWW